MEHIEHIVHSQGNWTVGENGGIVVTDSIDGFDHRTGHCETEYYGGYLIAESIHKKSDAHLISASPDLYDACRQLVYGFKHHDTKEISNGIDSALKAIMKAENATNLPVIWVSRNFVRGLKITDYKEINTLALEGRSIAYFIRNGNYSVKPASFFLNWPLRTILQCKFYQTIKIN